MNILKQSFELLEREPYEQMVKFLEDAGRTAYKSEGRSDGTLAGAEKFVYSILKRNHESVLEHGIISARLITDRGVTHELVRHRIGVAYTQECVSGDTRLMGNLCIKDAHARFCGKEM